MTAEDEESFKKVKRGNSQIGNKSTRSSTSLVDPPTPGDITRLSLETIAAPSPLTAKPDEFDDEKVAAGKMANLTSCTLRTPTYPNEMACSRAIRG